jgi:8-oxo-dGTP diphosphatase
MQQILDQTRYKTIPRTLIFLIRDSQILLLKYSNDKRAWGGLLNGIGGHIERGEDPLKAALREIQEEVGLVPQALRYCGSLFVDATGELGISIFVFMGKCSAEEIKASAEGEAMWVERDQLASQSTLADIPQLLDLTFASYESGRPFSAHSSADGEIETTHA